MALILPLIVSSNTNELFEFPKTYLFYVLGSILIMIFIIESIVKCNDICIKKDALVRNTYYHLPVILFVSSVIISTIFSSHTYTSVWGYYSRANGGLVSFLISAGIYITIVNKFKIGDFIQINKIIAISVIPVSILGIFQYYGILSDPVVRVYSTFGQPNWLAQYLVMILPFVSYLFIKESKYIWLVIFIMGYSCLWFTYSISGILGFAVVSLSSIFVFLKDKLLNRNTIIKLIIIYTILGLISFLNLGIFKDRINDVLMDMKIWNKDNTNVGYEADRDTDDIKIDTSISEEYKISDPGFIRIGLWKGAYNLWASSIKNIILGTGPETFPYEFQDYRILSLNYSSEWNYVFNKPHNYYLQLLSEMGLIGIISYVFLIISVFRRIPHRLMPGMIGFLFTNIFGWPVLVTSLLFWIYISEDRRKAGV